MCTKKPTVGTLKCNVDANFFVEQNCIGIGMCLRDSQRNLVMEKTCWKEPCLWLLEGAAWGLVEAFKFAASMGFKKVMFKVET